jgi:hypothetical protein
LALCGALAPNGQTDRQTDYHTQEAHLEQVDDALEVAPVNYAAIVGALCGIGTKELLESLLDALDKLVYHVLVYEKVWSV